MSAVSIAEERLSSIFLLLWTSWRDTVFLIDFSLTFCRSYVHIHLFRWSEEVRLSTIKLKAWKENSIKHGELLLSFSGGQCIGVMSWQQAADERHEDIQYYYRGPITFFCSRVRRSTVKASQLTVVEWNCRNSPRLVYEFCSFREWKHSTATSKFDSRRNTLRHLSQHCIVLSCLSSVHISRIYFEMCVA